MSFDWRALESRFWSKVERPTGDGCWNWTAAKFDRGYGAFGRWLAHRVSYEMCIGPIPEGMVIDHICHNTSCVNPLHLRTATRSQNQFNQLLSKSSTSGLKGVSWRKDRNRWEAVIKANGKRYRLGYFKDAEVAHQAYCAASKRLHGEFSNKGDEHGF